MNTFQKVAVACDKVARTIKTGTRFAPYVRWDNESKFPKCALGQVEALAGIKPYGLGRLSLKGIEDDTAMARSAVCRVAATNNNQQWDDCVNALNEMKAIYMDLAKKLRRETWMPWTK